MAQKEEQILPLFLQMDNAIEYIKANETPFQKGVNFDIDNNSSDEAATEGGKKSGYNAFVLTPTQSNEILDTLPPSSLPVGYNKNVGSFYSVQTSEFYYANYNSNGNHGIYVVNCNTGEWNIVIVDSNLPFTDNQEHFLKDHRWSLRISYDGKKNIIAKFLLFTNGAGWQGWINVIPAIKTNGFDSVLYPYWALRPPHFDRRELIEWAVRPIMYNPKVVPIDNTSDDAGRINRLIDQGFQFSAVVNLTDGRTSVLSPYSLPLIIKSEDFLNNPDNLPKKALITIDAGSCMVESIDLYVRKTAKQSAGIPSTISWGEWLKYDRIYKFTDCGINSEEIIGTEYWKRQNPWSGLNYDPVLNTIQYVFDNSKLSELPVVDTIPLQNDLPQISQSITPMGDAELLGNNRYGYNNLTCQTINNLDVEVRERSSVDCIVPLRKIRLYAYVGMCSDNFVYYSQVGYINGTDTTVRFGSLRYGGLSNTATFDVNESKNFGLDFSDKKAFRCYLKGTPYYSDGVWYQVNSDNSLVKLDQELDFSNNDTLSYIQSTANSDGLWVCVFDFMVPAGRYIATLGRHNVASSGDYRNTSTYIYGIANSRNKSSTIIDAFFSRVTTIKPNAIQTYSKEMELDCTTSDVDVWGNGQDLFYVYCPYITNQGNLRYRFIEGYLKESSSSPLGMELFPYNLTQITDDSGQYTDKNGFYFAYTKAQNSNIADIQFTCKLNCQYPTSFHIPTSQSGPGWRPNPVAYITDHNNGIVGQCNRIVYSGKITNIDGSIGYSNIAISIKDGAIVYTKSDGTFELIVHNGQSALRVSNVYVNAGGNFLITAEGCGFISVYQFNEALAPCINCQARNYPIQLILSVNVQGGTEYSLKENSTYPVGIALADLAGRLTFVNNVKDVPVLSFLLRDNVLPTYLRLLIKGALGFEKDLAWFAPYVGNKLNISTYVQWVGDSIVYVDNNGNVVSDPSSAVFCSISIQSLYNNNIGRNFSLLSTYQFTPEDRIRILDDGNGNLLDVNTYGDSIDLQVLGTNYNQAAVASGLLPNTSTNPIINNNISSSTTVNTTATPTVTTIQTTENNTNITLYVRYDSRLDKLIGNSGFWIEIYTPTEQSQDIPYNELEWHPIINGSVADFAGYTNGIPVYNYPTYIDLNFWDTYLFSRNITIPNVGDKFFSHPFESPNISDSFGYSVSSGGRQHSKNDNARQIVFMDDVIRSNPFTTGAFINGLGSFSSKNRKDFSKNNYGGINGMISTGNMILFVCENDWFTTTFDYHFTYPNAQGVMVVNLDNGLSTPSQKIGDIYGMVAEDTGTLVVCDRFVSWYDQRNQAWVLCNYQSANDITLFNQSQGVAGGVNSYINGKTNAIQKFNRSVPNSSRFDVIGGYDEERENIYLTFRPRRNNTNDPSSYGSDRRNVDILHQETLVYSLINKRFTRFENFTPESYGYMRGKYTSLQMISFAAGIPYLHNKNSDSYNEFFGIQYDPIIMGVFNQNLDVNKIFSNLVLSMDGPGMYVDFLRTNEPNSFSYVPMNRVSKIENKYYLTLLRDMNSYFAPFEENEFKSTLFDGKRIYNLYLLFRLIGDPNNRGQYFELKTIYNMASDSTNEKK
jgi:hypothetical protein